MQEQSQKRRGCELELGIHEPSQPHPASTSAWGKRALFNRPHTDDDADDDDLFSTFGLNDQTLRRMAIGLRGGNYASTPLSEIGAIAFQLARDTA
jgi:hypothetical protein